MHLGNGALTPECVTLTYSAAAIGLGAAVATVRRAEIDRGIAARAVLVGSAVLAAQAVNVPVFPFASGHLIGGVLAACLLGPSLGAVVMAAVLAVQAFALGDGGVAALGANVVNMALLPAGLVALAARGRSAESLHSGWRRPVLAGGLALASVVLAAGLIVGEIALGRSPAEFSPLWGFASRMLSYHAWIGLGEALLTAGVLAAVTASGAPVRRFGANKTALATVAAIALAAVALLPLSRLNLSSELPDGYQAAAQRSGMDWLLAE